MAGRRIPARSKGKEKATPSVVPDVYQDMLAEALPAQPQALERPLKRRRTGKQDSQVAPIGPDSFHGPEEEEEEDDVQFEDVLETDLPGGSDDEPSAPAKLQQIAYRDSDEDSERSDDGWEGFNLDTQPVVDEPSGDLELTISKKVTAQAQPAAARRRLVTKTEKADRLEKHKMHVLCLLSHVDQRNGWCNDSEVQKSLKPLLDKKMKTFLRPKSGLSQFGQADSLKRGLDQVAVMWRTRFSITTRGLRRALWAENEKDLQDVRYRTAE